MQPTKILKRSISGILLLDKPLGLSSNKALKKVQYLLKAKKAGHTGSLDPLATGLLPICLGEATKLSHYLLEADKIYRVGARLGQRTNTADAEGELIAEKPVPDFKLEDIEKNLDEFRGEIEQTPPIYSALKINGQPLYKYARQGIAIQPKPRLVTIYDLELLNYSGVELTLQVHCSKGTYIRSLVDDLGEKLGCGAHVIELRRVMCAGYTEDQMLSLDRLEQEFDANNPSALDHYLIPLSTALPHWPVVNLEETDILFFQRGQAIRLKHTLPSGWFKVCGLEGELLGLAEVNEEGLLAPRRVFVN